MQVKLGKWKWLLHIANVFTFFLCVQSVTIMIMPWTGAHRVFAVKTFFMTVKSIIPSQKAFHAHFMLC